MAQDDALSALLIDAYHAGIAAGGADRDGGGYQESPLSGEFAGGYTTAMITTEFHIKSVSVSADFAMDNGTDFEEELEATESAIVDSWENGYLSVDPSGYTADEEENNEGL